MRDRSLADRLAREAQRPSYSDRQVKNVDLLDFLVRTSPTSCRPRSSLPEMRFIKYRDGRREFCLHYHLVGITPEQLQATWERVGAAELWRPAFPPATRWRVAQRDGDGYVLELRPSWLGAARLSHFARAADGPRGACCELLVTLEVGRRGVVWAALNFVAALAWPTAACLDWCVQNGELHSAAFVALAGAPVGGSAAPRVREAAGHRLDAPPHVLDAGDPPFSFFLLLSAALALVAYAVGWRPG